MSDLDNLYPWEQEAALEALVEKLRGRVADGDPSAGRELIQAQAELSLCKSTGVKVGAAGMSDDSGEFGGW